MRKSLTRRMGPSLCNGRSARIFLPPYAIYFIYFDISLFLYFRLFNSSHIYFSIYVLLLSGLPFFVFRALPRPPPAQ